jgi:N-acetylmuramoyl-L-alanine amidase
MRTVWILLWILILIPSSLSAAAATTMEKVEQAQIKSKLSWLLSQMAQAADENIKELDRAASVRDSPQTPTQPAITPDPTSSDTPQRLYTVIIDAGHGGKDSGAIGQSGTQEKKVVLRIAQALAHQLNATGKLRAVLTRNGDYFVPLRTRLQLARKGKADLFIAIHADAFTNPDSMGASIYALSAGGATGEAARWLAKRGNAAELGGVELDALQDHSQVLRSVLIDLAQTSTIKDSLLLGQTMLESMDEVTSLKYKHVEQAPFVVLKSPDIPSILIETGFITNPLEENRLADAFYQNKLATAIALGVERYAEKYLYKNG